MKPKLLLGIVLILCGAGLFVFYDYYVKPEKEAREMMAEAKMIFERSDRDSINQSINIFTRVIAKYPSSRLLPEAYYYIGQSYEKIGLNRLAYLKYTYLLKSNSPYLSDDIRKETLIRLAHLKVLQQYSEEGVNQLCNLLSGNFNNELRSRIYSELGHTYLRLGELQRSKRMFDISLSENGSNEEALLGKARAYKKMGEDNQAYDLYEYFLKYYGGVSPYAGDVRTAYREQAYRSGMDAFRRGNYNTASVYFSRVLKNFSGDKISENCLYWIGECHFAQRKFDTAIAFFDRALSNSFTHKDQDAQIKKGYAYFLSKRFDLAAREFQTYLRNYPDGRYVKTAREWKSMSTKELLYRIEEKQQPDSGENTGKIPEDSGKKPDKTIEEDEEVAGDYTDSVRGEDKIELENVAEL